MANIVLANQSAPSTPATANVTVWADSTSKKLVATDDSGVHRGTISSVNPASGTASVTLTAATDVYVTDSSIIVPGVGIQVGQLYLWYLMITKTAAGTGVLVTTVRIGAAKTTSDTSIIAMTSVAQTATAIGNLVQVGLAIRTAGASGVGVGGIGGGGTALATCSTATGVSGSIDFTGRAGQFVGLSMNMGTGDTGTCEYVKGLLIQ